MVYIVPIIIYETIENSSASKGKFITLIQILVKKNCFTALQDHCKRSIFKTLPDSILKQMLNKEQENFHC